MQVRVTVYPIEREVYSEVFDEWKQAHAFIKDILTEKAWRAVATLMNGAPLGVYYSESFNEWFENERKKLQNTG